MSELSLGKRFEAERERVGLTRAQLAFDSGYSPEQVRRVEIDQQKPGCELLAALMQVGGDVLYVLGAQVTRVRDRDDKFPTADEMHAAQRRERIRLEAREHARLKNDRRKRVVTDDEADLLDAYRDLSAADRAAVLAAIAGGRFEPEAKAAASVSGRGNRVAGRDFIEGKKR